MRRLASAGPSLFLLLVAGCASFDVNPRLEQVKPKQGYRYADLERPQLNSEKTFVVVTLSGGGTRAAALAYGALKHLDETPIDGGSKTLLDEVDVISSVSGGSFASAYYALSQDKRQFFEEFPRAVLYRKIQKALVLRVLAPWNWPKLLSPRFGRSDLIERYYDRKIFHGVRYGDMPQRLPFTILNGTDMSLGAQFPFTQDDFDRLCSDLSRVKLSRAVLSSSAFPGAFTPLTWKNYRTEGCDYENPPWVDLAYGNGEEDRGDLETNPPRYDRARTWESYGDPERRFIHVVDGGVSDNIGLRGPTVGLVTNDSPWSVLNRVNPTLATDPDKIDRVVVIAVDAKPRSIPKRDRTASPPGLLAVLSAAASRPTANYSTDTVERLRRDFRDWDKAADDYEATRQLCDQLAEALCPSGSGGTCAARTARQCREHFAATDADRPPHPDLYLVHVRFEAVADPKLRSELLQVPTKLQLPRSTVDELIAVAGALLDQSPAFQRLRRDLE